MPLSPQNYLLSGKDKSLIKFGPEPSNRQIAVHDVEPHTYWMMTYNGFVERSTVKQGGYGLIKLSAHTIARDGVEMPLGPNECVMGARNTFGAFAVVENGRLLRMSSMSDKL